MPPTRPADGQPHRRRHGGRPHREGHRLRAGGSPSRRRAAPEPDPDPPPPPAPRTPRPLRPAQPRPPTRPTRTPKSSPRCPTPKSCPTWRRCGGHALSASHRSESASLRRAGRAADETQVKAPGHFGGTLPGRALRRAGTGDDRWGVAMAVHEKQHAQPDLGIGPGVARHHRPQRTIRRRELPHRRRGQPLRPECRHGRRRHCGRRRCALRYDHAGQHSGEPPTRCGSVLSA